MSDASVSERRIRPIQDAVLSANWKQALQLCDKWSKKGERSDRFLALKAFVLVHQPDEKLHDRGHDEVLDLCKRTPPVTEPEAIYQLQKALKALSIQQEEGPKVWERAASSSTQDGKDLYIRWLNEAVAESNWLSAQKATMGLRKSFPKDRNYEFWNIAMCSLVHRDVKQAGKDRALFGMLAYRMICKAAETIPTDQEQVLSPGKAISTPEEVALLAQILNSTDRASETVKLLQSATLNLESRVGKQDPQLTLSLLLDAFEASEQWEEAQTFSFKLLSDPEHQSDDRIWKLWLKARSKVHSNEKAQSEEELLESACTARPISRASYLAKLEYLETKDDDKSLDAVLQTCEEYAGAFSTKAFCFDDLKRALLRLDEKRLRTFRDAREAEEGSLAKLFALKLEYRLLPNDAASQTLITFASGALRVYQESLATKPACPEAALLAVLAILRLAVSKNDHDNTLRAVILLESVRSAFEDYYLLTVILIRLQNYLGLPASAMSTYTKLSVKNMQYETIAHLVLTRISSLHPFPSTNTSETFDPLRAIDTGLNILDNADGALVRGIREGLRFNSYSNLHNSVSMRQQLEHSASRHVYAIEERKLRRLRGLGEDTVLEAASFDADGCLADNRDFSYFPTYREDDRELLLTQFRAGPLPREAWVRAMARFDHALTYLAAESAGQTATAAKVLQDLYASSKAVEESKPDPQADELTVPETANLECHAILAEAAQLIGESAAIPAEKIADLFSRLETWLQNTTEAESSRQKDLSTVAGIPIYTWSDLHASLTRLETLQGVAVLLGVLGKKTKTAKGKSVPKNKLVEIQASVTALEKLIHDGARQVKQGINEPGVLGKLVDLGFARDEPSGSAGDDLTAIEAILERVTDEATMETVCGRVKNSWENALDGVLAVKVKLSK